jgi:hypothetical protein
VHQRARRHRHHQQEPARLDDQAARRHPLHHESGLRRNGLIDRIPDTNRYRLTGDGPLFAIFYTKVHDWPLRPLLAADLPPAPPPLRKALQNIGIHMTETIDRARLLPNAA